MEIVMEKKEGKWTEDVFPFFKAHHRRILVDGKLFMWRRTTRVDNKCIILLQEMIEFHCKKDNKTVFEIDVEDCWRLTQGSTIKECQGCKLYSGN